jgi:hypothetical protein
LPLKEGNLNGKRILVKSRVFFIKKQKKKKKKIKIKIKSTEKRREKDNKKKIFLYAFFFEKISLLDHLFP